MPFGRLCSMFGGDILSRSVVIISSRIAVIRNLNRNCFSSHVGVIQYLVRQLDMSVHLTSIICCGHISSPIMWCASHLSSGVLATSLLGTLVDSASGGFSIHLSGARECTLVIRRMVVELIISNRWVCLSLLAISIGEWTSW
jgi:hypothetical protein